VLRRDGDVTASGFHAGELAVQRKAGVQTEANRLVRMLEPADLSGGIGRFLALQNFAALTGRDAAGILWISPLAAPPGFLQGDETLLHIAALPRDGDPLRDMQAGQQVGLVAVDFAARRRVRVNGLLSDVGADGMTVRAEQAYGNCPQYIHPRTLDVGAYVATRASVRHATTLAPADHALIGVADTFFLGTTHPSRGSDASHRGGPAGFVRVESPNQLSWPDYPGNNMFNSLGNLAVGDEAALLFTDFPSGATVQLAGTASVRWLPPGSPDDEGGVGRRVEFSVATVVAG
jgi:predicted pyridoxine 5'-phosphate oxidase superfamily flavin-nucleotide-binding protein